MNTRKFITSTTLGVCGLFFAPSPSFGGNPIKKQSCEQIREQIENELKDLFDKRINVVNTTNMSIATEPYKSSEELEQEVSRVLNKFKSSNLIKDFKLKNCTLDRTQPLHISEAAEIDIKWD